MVHVLSLARRATARFWAVAASMSAMAYGRGAFGYLVKLLLLLVVELGETLLKVLAFTTRANIHILIMH